MSDFKLSQTFAAIQVAGFEQQAAGGFSMDLLDREEAICKKLVKKYGKSSVGVDLRTGIVVVNDATVEDVQASLKAGRVRDTEYVMLPQNSLKP